MFQEIFPNLFRVEIPLPDNPLRFLNAYVITSPERNLIIDTGFDRKECLEAMMQALHRLDVDLERTDFFVTHLHADHIGLIPRLLTKKSNIYFNKIDEEIFEMQNWRVRLKLAIRNGFPEKALAGAADARKGYYNDFDWINRGKHAAEETIIRVGDCSFRCLSTPGHMRGHTCLVEDRKKILVAGDHLLKDITPIIQAWINEANPLKAYLSSLEKIQQLDVDLVLPGHGELFRNCKERISELKEHHRVRAEEILSVLSNGPKTAFQVAAGMKWNIEGSWEEFPMEQKWFATGEAIAHLQYLEEEGMIFREEEGEQVRFHLGQPLLSSKK